MIAVYGERGSLTIDLARPYQLERPLPAERTHPLIEADDALLQSLLYPSARNSLAPCCILQGGFKQGKKMPLLPPFKTGWLSKSCFIPSWSKSQLLFNVFM